MSIIAAPEMFDIVNENNEPLGFAKSRIEVHESKQYWHRATHIWIINDKFEILCQQRSLLKDVNPGKWQSFFGGHLKAGQTYDDNAIEEVSEELGLPVNRENLFPIHVLKSEPAKHFGQVYLLWWNGDINLLSFKDNEVAGVKWFTVGELRKKIDLGDFCNRFDPFVEKELLSRMSEHAKGDK